jgi:hypothetical protein
MAKYLLVYHGNPGMPDTPEEGEKAMQAWMGWFGTLGAGVVDGGNPIARAWTVSTTGTVEGGGSNPTVGYSILQAPNMDAALVMAKGCPHLEGDGTVELCEILELGG